MHAVMLYPSLVSEALGHTIIACAVVVTMYAVLPQCILSELADIGLFVSELAFRIVAPVFSVLYCILSLVFDIEYYLIHTVFDVVYYPLSLVMSTLAAPSVIILAFVLEPGISFLSEFLGVGPLVSSLLCVTLSASFLVFVLNLYNHTFRGIVSTDNKNGVV